MFAVYHDFPIIEIVSDLGWTDASLST